VAFHSLRPPFLGPVQINFGLNPETLPHWERTVTRVRPGVDLAIFRRGWVSPAFWRHSIGLPPLPATPSCNRIQVSGHVGRRANVSPGLVITISLYAQVEPTSVTPFATPVLRRALHASVGAYTSPAGQRRQRLTPQPTTSPNPASATPPGQEGALRVQPHWYVNDVLYYAARYGGGTILGDPNACGPRSSTRNLPPLTTEVVSSACLTATRVR
jgi:hypothetical protein